MKDKNQYREGLHTLRFFAALLVLIGHSRQNLVQYNIRWFDASPVFYKGGIAVDFFFVLSGFLLTFLAIGEYKRFGQINIRNFFLRRVFRVLPLYYLSVLLGYLLLGVVYPAMKGQPYLAFSISEGLPYHLLLLPNYVIARWPDDIGALYSLWSIGVEEQYYLFFPFLMGFVFRKNKALSKMLIITAIFFALYWLISQNIIFIADDIIRTFLLTMRFHMMLIGGISAIILVYYYATISTIVENKVFQLITWLFLLVIVFYRDIDIKFDLLHGLVFGLLLLFISNKKNRLINVEIKPFVYLGSISYGIYIFHPYVSYFLRLLMEKSNFILHAITALPVLYYIVEILLSILVAHISYQYYEKYFLKIKAS